MGWLRRLRGTLIGSSLEDRLDEEMRFHLDERTDDYVRRGMTPEDARRESLRRFGNATLARERARDADTLRALDEFLQDVRYAARLLRRNPLFALTAALSLAIGIGANTTIFTVARALLFHVPAGVMEPGRLVDIGFSRNGGALNPGSYPNYLDVRERTTTLDGVYAQELFGAPMSLKSEEGVERIFGNAVTTNYFSALGARPAAGRLFDADDPPRLAAGHERSTADPIVVLSHRFWTRRFEQDPAAIGRTLQLNGQLFIVAGVASEGFQGTRLLAVDVWLPLNVAATNAALTNREGGWLAMGGRLKPGVSLQQAAADLGAIGRALEHEYPDQNRGKDLRIAASSPLPGNNGLVAGFFAVLMGIVSIVLAVASANVAGVLLARAAARRREMAVRLAMGAGRARLVRQLLTETLMLFVLGGTGGLLLARGLTSLLVWRLPALPFPVNVSLALDGRAVAYTMGLSLMAALLSGLAPALQASRADVVSALKDDSPQGPSDRWLLRQAFVVGQVALTIMLVVCAGLFVRALLRAGSTDPGFDRRGVELVSLDLAQSGYTNVTGPRFARELLDRVRLMPGTQNATIASNVPGGFETQRRGLTVPGVPPPDGQRFFGVDWNIVEPGYFATLRIPVAAGRDFDVADRDGTQPVAIVGEGAARQFWPGQNAVGKYLVQPPIGPQRQASPARTLLVVGVARDVKTSSLIDGLSRSLVYVPLQQQYVSRITIVARTTHGGRLADGIRTLVTSMDPNLPIAATQTLEDATALGLVPQRVAASVSASLGLVGLLLAAIGIYGVTAYWVTRRTREIGIRLALGAQRADIVRMVLRQGLSLLAVGCAIGLTLAAFASRAMAVFLFDIPPIDPLVFGGAAALFAAVALTACYVPVRCAVRIDAMDALRHE